eukprot:TRINITY_DN57892_c0_g1_i1.p1 TRINITY_DN57892_c0_g1~~TRINITY_DN57892_c0_g1_i1.p1  ORF type:complete len:583 (-),score=127.94 TRINITY_DN57892_c0_g1_i1:134-1882(-)
MASTFLSRLPGRLTQVEVQLRDHLFGAARAAQQLFPPDNTVSLQEWVESRMPGELELGTDSNGMVVLKMPRRGNKRGGTTPELSPAASAFLSRLPGDSFFPEEEQLREAIVDALSRGPVALQQLKRERRVISVVKAFIPDAVGLEDWIERRIGGEVSVDRDGPQMMVHLAGAAPPPTGGNQQETKEAFFARLPKGAFLPEEERMRLAIFDFLAGWSSQELATLSHATNNPNVREAKRVLLDSTAVKLKDWIEHRIGAEISLKRNSRNQDEIHLSPAARPFVAERVAVLRSAPPAMPPPMQHHAPPMRPPPAGRAPPPQRGKGERSEPQRNSDQTGEAAKATFFSKLPAEELLDQELELRQIVLDFLDKHKADHPSEEGPLLADIGKDKQCRKLRGDFLQGIVSLREWIDRRIGGEIATKTGPNAQVIVCYRDGMAPESTQDADDGAEASGTEAQREAFFKSLPPDGFLPEEEALREALLNFLENWTSVDPPNLTDAGSDPEIREARMAALPKTSGCSLKLWIDRRIGGEIATWRKDGTAMQISWGLRDVWDETSIEANRKEIALSKEGGGGRKRKAEAQGGR